MHSWLLGWRAQAASALPSLPGVELGWNLQVKWQEQAAGSRLYLPWPCHPAAAPWANICSGKCLAQGSLGEPLDVPHPQAREARLVLLSHSQGMFGFGWGFFNHFHVCWCHPFPSLASGEVGSRPGEQGCVSQTFSWLLRK